MIQKAYDLGYEAFDEMGNATLSACFNRELINICLTCPKHLVQKCLDAFADGWRNAANDFHNQKEHDEYFSTSQMG